MIQHDGQVGRLLDLLDELGIADDTIVQYSTDNGPHLNTWPDSGMTPFRCEKNSNWEGAYRVPCMVRITFFRNGPTSTKVSSMTAGMRIERAFTNVSLKWESFHQ